MAGKAPVTVRMVLVTLDAHLADAFARAGQSLARDLPGLDLRLHIAADWATDPAAAERCRADLRTADLVAVTQIFVEEMAAEILPVLREHQARYASILCALCTSDLVKLTRLGRFSMADESRSPWSPMTILRKLRGGGNKDGRSSGERQMQVLRMMPKLLKFIPGGAQDLRVYLLSLQYWLAGTDSNIASLVRLHVSRYATGLSAKTRERLVVSEPEVYPEVGVYHPDLPNRGMAESVEVLPRRGKAGTVGVLVGRSYLLAGNTAHYDAVIRGFEAQGLSVIAAFASALDARPAIDRFMRDASGMSRIDALVSLTGFSLVGGPAYNDRDAAQAVLQALDVPYLSLQTLEFQTIEEWDADARGLNPLQATLQVALPELDGATGSLVFGGKRQVPAGGVSASHPVDDRVSMLARRVSRLVSLRRKDRSERKLAIVLFNFPPNAGNTGSAAYLAVFPSLQRTLAALKEHGYTVHLPDGGRRPAADDHRGQRDGVRGAGQRAYAHQRG